jgi:hypothetical protein
LRARNNVGNRCLIKISHHQYRQQHRLAQSKSKINQVIEQLNDLATPTISLDTQKHIKTIHQWRIDLDIDTKGSLLHYCIDRAFHISDDGNKEKTNNHYRCRAEELIRIHSNLVFTTSISNSSGKIQYPIDILYSKIRKKKSAERVCLLQSFYYNLYDFPCEWWQFVAKCDRIWTETTFIELIHNGRRSPGSPFNQSRFPDTLLNLVLLYIRPTKINIPKLPSITTTSIKTKTATTTNHDFVTNFKIQKALKSATLDNDVETNMTKIPCDFENCGALVDADHYQDHLLSHSLASIYDTASKPSSMITWHRWPPRSNETKTTNTVAAMDTSEETNAQSEKQEAEMVVKPLSATNLFANKSAPKGLPAFGKIVEDDLTKVQCESCHSIPSSISDYLQHQCPQ